MDNIDVRKLQPDEMQAVVALHRSVFPASQWMRSIYASDQVWRYLSNSVALSDWQREHVFLGVWTMQSLVGYAHFRALPESWHLNQIAVDKQFQGQQIGSGLFTLWIDEGNTRGYEKLTLDVPYTNEKVWQWYTRHGFYIVDHTWVYEYELSQPSSTYPYQVALKDWLTAEAWQSLYGFSEFQLTIEEENWHVGRLGKNYFRLAKYPSEILKQVLAKIDPRRHLLVLSHCELELSDHKPVQHVVRMMR